MWTSQSATATEITLDIIEIIPSTTPVSQVEDER